ncbi:MAG: Fe-S cluster assembly protein SufD, partial [Thermoanaerobaculia bacterium]
MNQTMVKSGSSDSVASPASVAERPVGTLTAWATQFARHRHDGHDTSPLWLQRLRVQALAAFHRLGLPRAGSEEWRFTHVAGIDALPFFTAGEDDAVPEPNPADVDSALSRLDAPAGPRLVFVNGDFDAGRSSGLDETGKNDPIGLGRFSTCLQGAPLGLEPFLGRTADFSQRPFVALNTVLMGDGALLLVPDGVVVAEPIEIVHVAAPCVAGTAFISHPRTLIVLGRGCEARVVEIFLGAGTADPGLVNSVTEVVLGPGARLEHDTVQLEGTGTYHFSSLDVRQERDSSFVSNLFSFGSLLARNEIELAIDGEGASGTLNGLVAARGNQHVDCHSVVDHRQPHGGSQEYYKCILAGAGRGVFDGKIVVRPGATKTDAHQKNRNLLLSELALIDSKPQLEIYNNDVRCTHGSTTGRLDPDALFYLRSRGLDA